MTEMIFHCICGYQEMTWPIFSIGDIKTCPKCNAKYEVVKQLKAHVTHYVPVFKNEKGELSTLSFITFAAANNSDWREYLQVLTNQFKKAV